MFNGFKHYNYLFCMFNCDFYNWKNILFTIKTYIKLLINSILGGVLIYIVNIVGASFNFHVGLNFGTAIFTGLLGIPGVVVLVLVKVLIGWVEFLEPSPN